MVVADSYGQGGALRNLEQKGRQLSNVRGNTNNTEDSLRKRNKHEDSITIRFRYLDSTQLYKLDSSIGDYSRRFPVPYNYITLGNNGTAAKNIFFTPQFNAGFDPGFHSLDLYKWTAEKSRFFNTTRPYSELNYGLASKSEQLIELLHTQNIKPNWNFLLEYRMINAPGFMKNQKTSHNNYLFSNWYQSKNKRYNNYFTIVSNKLQASESGGMIDTPNVLKLPVYYDRYNIPTKIGGDAPFGNNFFNTKIGVGNTYKDFKVLMRQQYDLGRKDSIVTDSTIIPLFFPRLRFEHTISYASNEFQFEDGSYIGNGGYLYQPDSIYYATYYQYTQPLGDTFLLRDKWKEINNDFSIYQFPDAKNQHQYIKLGAGMQNLTGQFAANKVKEYNVYGHAEYRNKSKNQKWDIVANGKLYFTGMNAGDYAALASLQRVIGEKAGTLKLGFKNVNRTPNYSFNSNSSFFFPQTAIDLKKENTTELLADYSIPSIKLRLTGNYYLLNNYSYLANYYEVKQHSSLFNVLRVGALKTIKVGKHWNWHAELYLQQVIGEAPVNLPLLFTRHRFAYEGNVGFKNLDLAVGTEIRYNTPYKADGYSPALGMFYYQNSETLKNNLPDITAYLNFRIKSFKAFVRVENLNTLQKNKEGIGFTNNNLATFGYPTPGAFFRMGIYWSFVN